MTAFSDTLTAAQDYMRRGLRVVPLARGAKLPPAQFELAKYQTTVPTEEDINHWFGNGSGYNIGVLMGRPSKNLVLVDLDTYKNENLSSIEDRFPTHMKAQSASGGKHLFYTVNSNIHIPNTQNVLEGMDIKFTGGYAVVAPSVYKNGQYRWLEYGEASPLPPELLDMIMQKSSLHSADQPQPDEDSDSLLTRIIANGFTPGAHNQEIHRIARNLYRRNVPETAIAEILIALDAKDKSPQGYRQVTATIATAIRYERDRISKEIGVESNPRIDANSALSSITLGDILSRWGDYETKYIIDDWLPENSIIMLVAPPEAGKTWLGLELAISAATGLPFIDRFNVLTGGVPTLIIQQEDFIGYTAQRVRTLFEHKIKQQGANYLDSLEDSDYQIINLNHAYLAPLYFHTENLLSFTDESIAALERLIIKHNIKVIYVDPLYSISDKTDDHYAHLAPLFKRHIKRLRDKYGLTFIFVHHSKKGANSTGEREQILGSQLLNGTIEGAIILYSDSGQKFVTRSGKAYDRRLTYSIEFDINTTIGDERFVVLLGDADSEGVLQLTGKHDAEIMDYLTTNPLVIAADVARHLNISNKVAGDSLNRLVGIGAINRKGRKYYIPEKLE